MDGHPSITSNAQQLRVVKQLLWEVISLHLYPAERDEIRRALGTALLDDNETLFAEAGALADILGDVTLNTSALLARHQLCSNPQRSMVETEIRLLIERLHASAAVSPFGSSAVKDRDPDSLLPRHGKRDRAVLDYMTTVAQITEAGVSGVRPPSSSLPPRPPSSAVSTSSRPGTASRPPTALSASNVSASISLPSPLSRPGTASPTLQGSRPSTAASSASASSAVTRYTDAPSVVAGLADKLNVASIDTVRETLRTALLEERTALLEDVEYLQGLLDVEADLQVRATVPPPSLAELKDYSSRLAAVVTNEEARLEHEVRVKAMFAAAEQQQSKPGRLRGMVDASRRPTSGGAGAPSAPARRSSVSGGAQTLVVHHGGDEQVVRQQSQRLTSGSSVTRVPGAVAAAAAADGGSGGSGPPSRAAQLLAAPLRRPGSGGSSGGAAASVFAPPPVLLQTRISTPPSADGTTAAINRIQAVASSAAALTAAAPPSPPDRNNLRPVAASSAAAAAAVVTGVPPPSSTSSPLLQARNHTSQQHPSQQHSQTANQPQLLPQLLPQTSYREKSPSRRMPPSPARHAAFTTAPLGPSTSPAVLDSTGAVLSVAESGGAVKVGAGSSSVAAAAAAATAAAAAAGSAVCVQRPTTRPGSVGRRSAGSSIPVAATAGAAASVPVNGTTGGSSSSSSSISRQVAAVAVEAAAASRTVAASGNTSISNNALTARLGGDHNGAVAAVMGAESYSGAAAVHPRALLGNKQSVVERLDEEVDKVKGGVAAILERYNIRPSSAPSSDATAAAATAAVATPTPPVGSRGGPPC